MNKILMAAAICSTIVLSGCQGFLPAAPIKGNPVNGYIYSSNSWDGKAPDNSISELKVGTACAKSYLGMVALGSASIEDAKIAGNITKVSSIDHSSTNYFVFYGTYCTIVRGE